MEKSILERFNNNYEKDFMHFSSLCGFRVQFML